ncbi:MAG: biotin/lipoyl-binding protein [Bacteroidales bacterium]|nr:biotin/lipoyl-binding protein [Bacteroidales bacterium]
MAYEVNVDDRTAKVELAARNENQLSIKVDDITYDVDLIRVEEGVYSILYNGKSYNVELIESGSERKYVVNTLYNSYNVEVVDAETRYRRIRNRSIMEEGESHIKSPMPGKVVSVPVKKGDEVSVGQTVIIVSAMKMESEFKAKKDGTIKDILVNEGDTVKGDQDLIVIE